MATDHEEKQVTTTVTNETEETKTPGVADSTSSWSPGKPINDEKTNDTSYGPGVAVIHLGYTGKDLVYIAWANGTTNLSMTASVDPYSADFPASQSVYPNLGAASGAPSLCVFKGELCIAYSRDNQDNSDGIVVTVGQYYGNEWKYFAHISSHDTRASPNHGPSIALFDGHVYAAWISNDGKGTILISYHKNEFTLRGGHPWESAVKIGAGNGNQTTATPALCAYGDYMYCAWKSAGAPNSIYMAYSKTPMQPDSWTGYKIMDSSRPSYTTGAAPSMSVFNNQLWLAWKTSEFGGEIYVSSCSDPTSADNWPDNGTKIGMSAANSPKLVAANQGLFVIYVKNESTQIHIAKYNESAS